MKRTFILIHWDFIPRQDVTAALEPHLLPGGFVILVSRTVMIVFQSESTHAQIDGSLKKVQNVFYIFVEATPDTVALYIPDPAAEAKIRELMKDPFKVEVPAYTQQDLGKLRAELKGAEESENYERAAELRDLIAKVQK